VNGTLEPGRITESLMSGGQARSYLISVPAQYDGKAPVPLLFDFHGAGSMPEDQERISGYKQLSDAEGFVYVAPAGLMGQWTEGPTPDERFVRDLADTLMKTGCIDRKRIYATGCSAGGGMTNWLGCNASDLFAAIAPMCGTAFFDVQTQCKPAHTMPFMLVLGKMDTLNCWESASGKADFGVWCAKVMQQTFQQADQCNGPILKTHDGLCETIGMCKDDAEVVACQVSSGHGVYFATDMKVTYEAWKFLKRFYRR
jgi:polyhydroxybutyrate depolymerase